MRKNKRLKFLSLFLALVLVCSLAACGSTSGAESRKQEGSTSAAENSGKDASAASQTENESAVNPQNAGDGAESTDGETEPEEDELMILFEEGETERDYDLPTGNNSTSGGSASGSSAGGSSTGESTSGSSQEESGGSTSSGTSETTTPDPAREGLDEDETELDTTGASAPVKEDGTYSSKEEVALYLHTFGHLPQNYLTKSEAEALGWDSSKGNLWDVAPGKSIGGNRFGNYEGALPTAKNRKYYECDIDYNGGYRGAKRIIYSNDGLIYYTEDHYTTFELLYGEP